MYESSTSLRRPTSTNTFRSTGSNAWSGPPTSPGATGPSASLIDLRCGAGNTLEYLRKTSGISDIAGLDVSRNLLDRARELFGCETYYGSISDNESVGSLGRSFDFVTIAALHHLIGKTRKESRGLVRKALSNSVGLLKPGGHVIVLAPIFCPSVAMDAVFFVKKGVSLLTSKRVGVSGYWNNVGAPVV